VIRTGIITAPRPRSTLAESVRSYRAAGFANDVLVFSDGGDTVIADKVITMPNEERLGNKRNWIRALAVLSNGVDTGDWIMICEDDISWSVGAARDLVESLLDLKRRDALRQAGALSLYAPRRVTSLVEKGHRLAQRQGYTGMQQGRKTWGAQCYVFTHHMAMTLLHDGQFRAMAGDFLRDKNIDAMIGQCLNDRGLNIAYRIPCLVDHDLGKGNSSLGYADDRPKLETDYFRGPRA